MKRDEELPPGNLLEYIDVFISDRFLCWPIWVRMSFYLMASTGHEQLKETVMRPVGSVRDALCVICSTETHGSLKLQSCWDVLVLPKDTMKKVDPCLAPSQPWGLSLKEVIENGPLDLLSHETFMHWVFVKPPGTFKANLRAQPYASTASMARSGRLMYLQWPLLSSWPFHCEFGL